MDSTGAAEQSADLRMDQIAFGPNGGRATNGKLLLSGNGSSTIPVIIVKGGKASVRGIIGVSKTPAAVGPSAAGSGLPVAALATRFRC